MLSCSKSKELPAATENSREEKPAGSSDNYPQISSENFKGLNGLEGSWVPKEYRDSIYIFSRVDSLRADQYGYTFKTGGQLVIREAPVFAEHRSLMRIIMEPGALKMSWLLLTDSIGAVRKIKSGRLFLFPKHRLN